MDVLLNRIDELGYLPVSESGGALLFHLISKLYEQTALITTNLSATFWRSETILIGSKSAAAAPSSLGQNLGAVTWSLLNAV